MHFCRYMLTWLLAAGLLGGNGIAAMRTPCQLGVKPSAAGGACCCRERLAALRPCCQAGPAVERPCCRRVDAADGPGFRAAGCRCQVQAPLPAAPARESRVRAERVHPALTAWQSAPRELPRVGLERQAPSIDGMAWHTGPPLRVWLCDWRI
jgi:hypothetical protein